MYGMNNIKFIGNHLHVLHPEDCSLNVSKGYNFMECGIV